MSTVPYLLSLTNPYEWGMDSPILQVEKWRLREARQLAQSCTVGSSRAPSGPSLWTLAACLSPDFPGIVGFFRGLGYAGRDSHHCQLLSHGSFGLSGILSPGEKPFSCPHCSRAFADRSNLRAHLQTHSDVKKYQCQACARTFSRMSLLHKHQESGCSGCPR